MGASSADRIITAEQRCMPKRRKKPDPLEQDLSCRRPWTDYRAQIELQQRRWSHEQLLCQRASAKRLLDGDGFISWVELCGER